MINKKNYNEIFKISKEKVKVISLFFQGKKCGWCLFENGEYVNSSFISINIDYNKERIVNRIIKFLKEKNPDIVVFENYNLDESEEDYYVDKTIEKWCLNNNSIFIMFSPDLWKQYFDVSIYENPQDVSYLYRLRLDSTAKSVLKRDCCLYEIEKYAIIIGVLYCKKNDDGRKQILEKEILSNIRNVSDEEMGTIVFSLDYYIKHYSESIKYYENNSGYEAIIDQIKNHLEDLYFSRFVILDNFAEPIRFYHYIGDYFYDYTSHTMVDNSHYFGVFKIGGYVFRQFVPEKDIIERNIREVFETYNKDEGIVFPKKVLSELELYSILKKQLGLKYTIYRDKCIKSISEGKQSLNCDNCAQSLFCPYSSNNPENYIQKQE